MTTETTQEAVIPEAAAKMRERIRGELAEAAVTLGVINELTQITEGKWRELYAAEDRIRAAFQWLGTPLPEGRSVADAAAEALKEAEAAK